MTIRDKKIEEIIYGLTGFMIKTHLTLIERTELEDYFYRTIKDIIYSKDNEIGELKERLSLFQNTSVNLKMTIERLLINDKKRLPSK